MSAFIRVLFVLIGAYAGRTVRLGKFQFVNGQLEYRGTPEEAALIARTLERNWQAYPQGHPALENQPEEPNHGQRDLSPGTPGANGASDVSGGGQPEGAGAEAGGEGGGESAGSEAGEAQEQSAVADGQPEGVNEPQAEANVKLQKAIAKLDPKEDAHWTAAGLPAMTAVEGFYGSANITRADVEAAAPGYTRATASK